MILSQNLEKELIFIFFYTMFQLKLYFPYLSMQEAKYCIDNFLGQVKTPRTLTPNQQKLPFKCVFVDVI